MQSIIDKIRELSGKNVFIKRLLKLSFGWVVTILDNRSIRRYNSWLASVSPTLSELDEQRLLSADLTYRPLISIVVPVYDPPIEFFQKMIDSVLQQTYDNWQLVLVDDASPQPTARTLIQTYVEADSRFVHKFLTENQHIAGATNEGIAIAEGEYIALLDNDDLLAPNALFEVVSVLNKDKNLQFIYTDEEKYTEKKNGHYSPYFKPSWNPDFLHSVNYITHFAVIQKSTIQKVGGLDGRFNGAQDWELFLRIGRNISSDQIYHIPKIVYSWRVHARSTADKIEAKPYVVSAQKLALTEDLAVRGYQDSEVVQDYLYSAQWRINYPLPEVFPDILIIVNDEFHDSVRDDIMNHAVYGGNYTIVTETSWTQGQAQPGDVLVFIDRDTDSCVLPDWLEWMLRDAVRDDIGFVVARDPDSMRNISQLVSPEALLYIKETSLRDITKHMYSTTRYNIPQVHRSSVSMIERKKLGSEVCNNEFIEAVSLKLSQRITKNLYNPYITL